MFSEGVWELPGDVLDQAEKVIEAALVRYRKCLQTGEWPTGYEGAVPSSAYNEKRTMSMFENITRSRESKPSCLFNYGLEDGAGEEGRFDAMTPISGATGL